MKIRTLLVSLLLLCVSIIETRAQSDWTQWGGPNRDFIVNAKGLAATWPANGPKQLWSRPLGAGHSAILASGNTLYTTYGVDEQEVVIALAADTGKTIWEHKYASPSAGMNYEYGIGPHSTPLLVGDLLYSVGATGKLFALDKKTGKVAWSHDLWKDLGGRKMDRGYSCSPIAYKNTIILTLGGQGQTLIAFNQKDGVSGLEEPDARHVAVFTDHRERGWPGSTDCIPWESCRWSRSKQWQLDLDSSARD